MRSQPILRQGTGIANGTFGELLQGSLQGDNHHFLVTLPIQRYSKVVFTPKAPSETLTVNPAHKIKSRELVQKLIAHFGFSVGGELTIESELTEGKGMASSSADMVAAARALEASMSRAIPVEVILALLRTIEPSDGVMYSEFVTFFHRKVQLCRLLGSPSRLRIVACDEGGQIDTIEHNQRNHFFTRRECAEYAGLLNSVEKAIVCNDLIELGAWPPEAQS